MVAAWLLEMEVDAPPSRMAVLLVQMALVREMVSAAMVGTGTVDGPQLSLEKQLLAVLRPMAAALEEVMEEDIAAVLAMVAVAVMAMAVVAMAAAAVVASATGVAPVLAAVTRALGICAPFGSRLHGWRG